MNQKEREECRMRASIATTMQEEEREGGKKESKTFSPRKMVVISRVEVWGQKEKRLEEMRKKRANITLSPSCVYVYTGEEEGDVEPSFFDDEPTRAK